MSAEIIGFVSPDELLASQMEQAEYRWLVRQLQAARGHHYDPPSDLYPEIMTRLDAIDRWRSTRSRVAVSLAAAGAIVLASRRAVA